MRYIYIGRLFQIDGVLGVLVSKVAGRRFIGLLALLCFGVVFLSTAAGQAQHSPRSLSPGKLAQAADITSQQGQHSKLPPHISTLLGITKEEECPVMQGVVRTGKLVQGIDVSVKDKNDIVLFVVDETTDEQSYYLTSPQGTLRRVLSVTAGVGHVLRIADKDRESFKKEKQFWVNRLVPAGPAK
jgi:hypothetical protein